LLKIVEPTEIQQKAIPLLLANTTDLVGLAKAQENSCFWIASFTINRYKLIFDTGACSYKGVGGRLKPRRFCKYLQVSIAAVEYP
jgi:hypothetical protein